MTNFHLSTTRPSKATIYKLFLSVRSHALCALCGDKCKTCAHVSSLLVNSRLAPVDERLGLAHSYPCSATSRPVPKQTVTLCLRRKVKKPHVHKKKKFFVFRSLVPRATQYGSTLAKAAALRITLNIDGAPITSRTHTHPSHSSQI
jgi:hypothetical protein